MSPRKAVLGITCGDPAGVGPEIVQAICSEPPPPNCEYRLIGTTDPLFPGKPSEVSARLALEALEDAAELALRREVDALITGPVSKHNLRQIGFPYPGQTEFFAARCATEKFAMLLTGGGLTVVLATAHIPLRKVPTILTPERIADSGELLHAFLLDRGVETPRIAVAGLNPHAGENGDLGSEEFEIVAPGVEELQRRLPSAAISGPHPPDTLFYRVLQGEFDGVVCMFHDQGLIPLKMTAFHEGVNVTLGLPFLRASPDHGTAFDIAGKGIASPSSSRSAIRLIADLITRKPPPRS